MGLTALLAFLRVALHARRRSDVHARRPQRLAKRNREVASDPLHRRRGAELRQEQHRQQQADPLRLLALALALAGARRGLSLGEERAD